MRTIALVAPIALLVSACCCRPCPAPCPSPCPPAPPAPTPVSPLPSPEARFPDYRPKTSPDVATDYRPAVGAAFQALPPADLASLPALLDALEKAKAEASKAPGRAESGNVALGADPMQYVPSDAEMLVSELGDRIARAVDGASAGDLATALADRDVKAVEYGRIAYRHVDVMGSGRFFYASAPAPARVALSR